MLESWLSLRLVPIIYPRKGLKIRYFRLLPVYHASPLQSFQSDIFVIKNLLSGLLTDDIFVIPCSIA